MPRRAPPPKWTSSVYRRSVAKIGMIAFSAGGRRTAIWSALKPEYEVPHIPTLPFDHSCSASHAIVVS